MESTNAGPKTTIQKVFFFLKLLEIRLRFIAVLLITALVVGYWDTIQNYWERWTRPSPNDQAAAHAHSETEFFCPMHPFVIRETMGKCPICGMDLIQRKKGAQETLPEGTIARVQVSPERIMQAGVTIEPVGYRQLTRVVDAYGTVEIDESRLLRVPARFPGRVEEVFVNSPGVQVKKDQPLAKIYSPKYLAATLEFVQAIQASRRAEADANADAESKRYAAEMAAIARKPLERQGFTKEQLDEIGRTEKTTDRVTLGAPMAGTVIEKNVVAGDNVDEGTILYTIADLSTVWVLAQVAEADLSGLKNDIPVDVATSASPGESLHGKIDLIYPSVNQENRTVKVRAVVANEDAKLKPGMYVTIGLRTAVTGAIQQADGSVLSIPESAVIDTGMRNVVYVETSSGVYDSRAVTLGARAGDYYPVIKGLAPTDKIVTRGSFLIDAEARLNPASAQEAGSTQPSTPPEIKSTAETDDYPLDTCVVTGQKLGVMGAPEIIKYQGRTVKLCCKACIKDFEKDPQKYLAKLDAASKSANVKAGNGVSH